ncbi:MAG TPA: universal stress protein [Thermomicrobiales bacterium]|nr:universal stress protein [Thermomicrobiales bacterium]
MADVTGAASGQTRILVPLDGSYLAEQAIPYAVALAGSGGEVVFFQASPEAEPRRDLSGDVKATASEVDRSAHSATETALRETANRWAPVLATPPAIDVATGDPAEEILAATERLGCGFVVMASHGRGALSRLAFGSVADRIARASAVPVLIVRPKEDQKDVHTAEVRRLLVPLDGSPLAAEALPVATAIAARLGIPVHLLQAINPATLLAPSPVGTGGYGAEVYTEIEDELTAAARENLDEAAKEAGAARVPVTTTVVEGPPVSAIDDAAEAGDLIVMTSHGRSGFRRWLLGSTAEKLVRTGPVPVLLVPASVRVEAGSR